MKKIVNNLKDLLLMLLKKALVIVNNLVKKKLTINFLVAILFLFLGLIIGYKNYDFFKPKVNIYNISFLYDSIIEIKTRFYKNDGKLAYKVEVTHDDNWEKNCQDSDLINLEESEIKNQFQYATLNFMARDKDGFLIDTISHNLSNEKWLRVLCDKKSVNGLPFVLAYFFEGEHYVKESIHRHYDDINASITGN